MHWSEIRATQRQTWISRFWNCTDCWKLGGCELHEDLGARVIAARLVAKDKDNKDVGIFLVSAYAPVSTASDEEWQDYYERLQECIDRRRPLG